MDSNYFTPYGAQLDDAFVILKQEVMLEPPSILTDLQAKYGGKMRFPFHVTCQRFPCSAEQLPEVAEKLEPYLRSIKPFSLSIDIVQSLHSEFFDCEVLKARAHPKDYLIEIIRNIDAIIDEQGLTRLYKSPSIWMTLLEGISHAVPETKIKPDNSLINIDFAIIDQLQAGKQFKRYREIALTSEIRI